MSENCGTVKHGLLHLLCAALGQSSCERVYDCMIPISEGASEHRQKGKRELAGEAVPKKGPSPKFDRILNPIVHLPQNV